MAKKKASDPPLHKLELVAIDDLTEDPRNARRHGDRNLTAIRFSLAAHGQQRPVVIDADNVILAGNGTVKAAKQLGWKSVQAIVVPLTGTEAMAYAIADNRTAELAEWDRDAQAEVLDQIGGGHLNEMGMDEAEVEALLRWREQARRRREDAAAGLEDWAINIGLDEDEHKQWKRGLSMAIIDAGGGEPWQGIARALAADTGEETP